MIDFADGVEEKVLRSMKQKKYCLQLGVKERLQKLHEGDEEARKQKRQAYIQSIYYCCLSNLILLDLFN